MKFFIGTSGYYYKDWFKIIYKDTKNLLDYYQKFLNSLEINSTFYRLPNLSSISKYKKYNLFYVFKLNKIITHLKKYDENILNLFLKIKEILQEKLLGILIQFPPKFSSKKENKEFILKLKKFFLKENIYTFFEFRHISWEKEEKFFKENNINVVKAYFPKNLNWNSSYNFSNQTAYYRIHGIKKLYFDNLEDHLEDIKNDILKTGKEKNLIFFNNTPQGCAFFNAIKLKKLLEGNEGEKIDKGKKGVI